MDIAIAMVIGVFFGNWLIVPLVNKRRTFKDGFWIGLIAAVICLVMYGTAHMVAGFFN